MIIERLGEESDIRRGRWLYPCVWRISRLSDSRAFCFMEPVVREARVMRRMMRWRGAPCAMRSSIAVIWAEGS